MMGIEKKQLSAFLTKNFFMLILGLFCVSLLTLECNFHLFLVKQKCSVTCISKVKGCLLLVTFHMLFIIIPIGV